MTTKREVLALTIFTIIIFAYPIAITVLLSVNASHFKGNIIHAWERYEEFYMVNFVVVAILLVITTYVSLSHMRKVFGEKSMQEEKAMKYILLLFTGTYAIRVIFAIILRIYEEKVNELFYNDNTIFTLSVYLLWCFWDLVPLMAMMLIHYKNFSSFANEEYLYCEYSVDDDQSEFMNDRLFDDDGSEVFDINADFESQQSSGIIELDSDDDETESEKTRPKEEGKYSINTRNTTDDIKQIHSSLKPRPSSMKKRNAKT